MIMDADPRGHRFAVFSDDRKYRYRLLDIWDKSKPRAAFVLLNPSTADEVVNDPTVARCFRRAAQLGYGSAEILNIFAFRSTDPAALYVADDPVGPANDVNIVAGVKDADFVICGWGTHGALHGRGRQVLDLLEMAAPGVELHCLSVNEDGSPGHPLYLAYSTNPVRYYGRTAGA